MHPKSLVAQNPRFNIIIVLFLLASKVWGECELQSSNEGRHLDEQITLHSNNYENLKTFGPFEVSGAKKISIEIEINSSPNSWSKIFVYDSNNVLAESIKNVGSANPLIKFWTKCSPGDKVYLRIEVPSDANFVGKVARIKSFGFTGAADSVTGKSPHFLNSAELNDSAVDVANLKFVALVTTDPNPDSLSNKLPTEVGYCTGTLLAPDLLLTAGHCFQFNKSFCKHTYALFGLDVVSDEIPKVYSCKDVVYLNRNLDFILLRLSSSPGELPFPKLSSAPAINDTKITIVQHPNGIYRRIANDTKCKVDKVGVEIVPNSQFSDPKLVKEAGIKHFCDTLGGSSGAPIFNDAGEIIAIQQAGDKEGNIGVRSDYISHCFSINNVSGEVVKQNSNDPICQ